MTEPKISELTLDQALALDELHILVKLKREGSYSGNLPHDTEGVFMQLAKNRLLDKSGNSLGERLFSYFTREKQTQRSYGVSRKGEDEISNVCEELGSIVEKQGRENLSAYDDFRYRLIANLIGGKETPSHIHERFLYFSRTFNIASARNPSPQVTDK